MTDANSRLPNDRLQRVHWTVEAESDEDLAERYDQWSTEYDADLAEVDGWAAPRFTAEIFARHVDVNDPVLDAGAGTGWVGRELRRLGFTHIDGIDYSQGMLDKAAEKNVYRSLRRMNLNQPMDLADDSYDAVICVGTLTYVTPDCLREFCRIVRKDGMVVFSAQPRVHTESGFQAEQDRLERENLWKLVTISEEMLPLPQSFPEVRFRTSVLQVL
jgi:predicted TPR repeat methyltransferase